MDPKVLIGALRGFGYQPTRQSGSHIRITTQRDGEHHEVVPAKKPLKVGTLQSILSSIARHHGVTVDELLRELRL